MKVLLSWIREFVDIDEPAEAIGRRLSLRGLALEGLEPWPPTTARGKTRDDAVLDFDVTANRPDCLSIAGIAREVAAVYDLPFRSPAERLLESSRSGGADAAQHGGAAIPITIEAPDLCPRYVGAVAEVAMAPSPDWLAERLTACGVRPISNVVDITNYVLLELGQPMHAFDHDRLAGPAIVVRRAHPDERLTTLDGKARALDSEMLVIADAERASAVGGIMGGAESEVSSASRRIVFEAAWFNPRSVRATSRRLGLRTEASMRFERGADISAPVVAMARACELLREIGAGEPAGHFIDVYPRPYRATTLHLARPRVGGLLGMVVPDAEIVRILGALGFHVEPAPHGWSVTAPPWRVDVHRDVDLIEEIGRHHGFEHLPVTFPGVEQAPAPADPRIARDARVRRVALASGFSEAISFGFIEARHAAPFLGSDPPVALANPLSEKFAVMRPSLVPGIVQAVGHNRRHGRRDIQLFEIGTRFSPHGETRALAMAWTGLATPDHWSGGRRDVDFFDMKGVAGPIARLFGADLTAVVPADGSVAAQVLVPGRACSLHLGNRAVGWLGQLVPEVADEHELPTNDIVYVAEFDLDALSQPTMGGPALARPLPRFPTAVRDIAMLLDESLSAANVRDTIQSEAHENLVSVVEFDRYQGRGIPDGKVSLALRLTFQSAERTLTDAEVDAATTTVVERLAKTLGAVRR
ncbi:MAG: phenylalanine--tRNA ligase subunit beta [Acidobacteriota bacterium]|nr:phenylalanine--tRNA ligase subunit beta [Acidobacteriota bacterium]